MHDRVIKNQHPKLHKLKAVVCEVPFTAFQIYEGGFVANCCFTWLPKTIGNINETSLLEMYAGKASLEIRGNVADGSYDYCDAKVCPRLSEFLSSGKIAHPLFNRGTQTEDLDLSPAPPMKRTVGVYLNYDKSCNLQCPSCRSEKTLYKIEDLPDSLKMTHKNTIKSVRELLDAGFRVMVNITGSGDPFASLLYWDFLQTLESHPNLLLRLQTNGLLMNDARLLPVIRELTDFVNISVDAATEPTYNLVRKGGAFQKLLKNVRNFDEMVSQGSFPNLTGWQLNFIVQEDNFAEIVPFTEWALTHKTVTNIWFNLIADWGHLTKDAFARKAIWMAEHPRHREFLEVVSSPLLRHPKVQLGNMSTYVCA